MLIDVPIKFLIMYTYSCRTNALLNKELNFVHDDLLTMILSFVFEAMASRQSRSTKWRQSKKFDTAAQLGYR